MRFIIGLAAALAVAGLGASLLYAAEDMQSLKRKPGLWEIVTVAPVSGMTKTRVCVGENDNLVMPAGADCTEPKLTPLLNPNNCCRALHRLALRARHQSREIR